VELKVTGSKSHPRTIRFAKNWRVDMEVLSTYLEPTHLFPHKAKRCRSSAAASLAKPE